MAEVVRLRVVRPYATEEEFLLSESFAINARSILLIDVPARPEGEIVRVELAIASGKSLLVAEGSVVRHLTASPSRPSGLVVRFRRMSATSNDFVKRAVACNADKSLPSSALASQPMASIPVPPPEPSQASPSSARSERPARPSKPPQGEQGGTSKPESLAPRSVAPRARSVSVIPAARRTSAPPIPPAPPSPTFPDATTDNRGSRPQPPEAAFPPPATTTARQRSVPPDAVPAKFTSPQPSRETGDARKVSGESSHHDTKVMARLRERHGNKAISVPPNREAILARLKKPNS